MLNKKLLPEKILWIDLEMTGLVPTRDLIIEVGLAVTDFDFNIIDTYESRVKHDKTKLEELFDSNEFYRTDFPNNKNQFLENLDSAKSSELVETEIINLMKRYFGQEPVILAGNSIHADRGFIKEHWLKLDKKLHYRMLDVSSWKIIMNSKFGVEFEKKSTHRALGDIEESINELKFYLQWFEEHGRELKNA
jgi:oligoribonuclease